METQVQSIQANWDKLTGLARDRWTQISAHDLQDVEHNLAALIERIRQKTGESREAIETYLTRMAGSLKKTAETATESVGPTIAEMNDQVRERVGEFEHLIKRYPLRAVALAFGAGLMGGLLVRRSNSQ